MSFYAMIIMAFGMSMDSFVAAIGKGAVLQCPLVREALRTESIFGIVEAITPVIGWAAGLAAITTSLDAMAVGAGLTFLNVNIVVTALMIGLATAIIATMGMLLGRFLGAMIGKWAEVPGGVVLIGIGSSILVAYLGLL
ncbi:MAG: hypothetical protein H6R25_2822 [Proteobacteria bacterium]|nr:hypothetical protein [Pseudomonadota bacterium]